MSPLALARTQRSFETLYRAHVSDVYRYALAVTGQTSDAEDVTQTTFMNAYRAYKRGERPRKPQNWLLTIAHNVCRQRARFAYYRVREVEFDENVVESLDPPAEVPSAADIRRALAHLPFAQRAVLVLRELEGRTHAEIAEMMGLTTQATEMLAFRARRALREYLAGSLTCTQAAAALDRQLEGRLETQSAGLLRAHLRECSDCERLARRLRAQQSAWKSLNVVALPTSLRAFDVGRAGAGAAAAGGAGVGAGVAAKVAAVTIAAVTAGGGAYLAKRDLGAPQHRPAHARPAHVQRHATRHHTVRYVAPASATSASSPTPVRRRVNRHATWRGARPATHAVPSTETDAPAATVDPTTTTEEQAPPQPEPAQEPDPGVAQPDTPPTDAAPTTAATQPDAGPSDPVVDSTRPSRPVHPDHPDHPALPDQSQGVATRAHGNPPQSQGQGQQP
jgi:RNA polymerase sigma factor (sigma-70 family)